MDDQRFDQITRTLGGVTGRRQAVKSIFGGAVATGLAALGLAEAAAKNKGKNGGKKGKHTKAQPSADCPVGSKVLLCHNPKADGSRKPICVDLSACDPASGNSGHCTSSHADDCVCPGYECCGDAMQTCFFCVGDAACGAVCIETGGDCSDDSMCCSGLTCNGSGRNRTCGPAPVDCSVEPDGTMCTPSLAGTSRKGKHKGKKAHAAGAPAGICCSGSCVAGDCCDNTQCSGTQICDQHQCENCREEGHPCTGNQVCCTDLTCASPINPGDDSRCCPPDATACGTGENGACCDNATETCSNNQCVPKAECQNSGDCNQQQGEICCDGHCVVGECCVNDDCNDGTICQVNPGTCNTDTHTCSYTNEQNGTYCGPRSASTRKSKGKGAQPAGAVLTPVCCDGDCVECCTNDNCSGGEICNDQHHCVPSCQHAGDTCDATHTCCEGLTCDATTGKCVSNGCGTGPACTGDQVCCGEGAEATCVDLGTNDNCLACGDSCSAGDTCCPDSGGCVDLNDSDNNNCGACGNKCPEGTACDGGTCVTPCGEAGADCSEQSCCAPLVCGGADGHTCVECTPNGGECSLAACCSPDFICKKAGKNHRCVKAGGGGGGGGGGGNGSGCFHVGGKPIPGKPCCPRLHEERGRCVINRWDHCDQSNRGQRSWCERGTTCEGGRLSPHHQEVCVPKSYRRRQRRRNLQTTTAPVTTPVS